MDTITVVREQRPFDEGRWLYPKFAQVMSNDATTHTFNAPLNLEDCVSMRNSTKVGPLGTKIAEVVLGVHGVISVSVSAFQLLVHISPAYSWEELEPQLATALGSVLNGEVIFVDKT